MKSARGGVAIALVAAAVAASAVLPNGRGNTAHALGASGSSAPGALSFQPVLGLPATGVEVIGASPEEAPGEVWAQGQAGEVPATVGGQAVAKAEVLLRYTTASGAWQIVPVQNGQGESLGFDWWGSEVTANGGVVLAGEGRQESGEEEASGEEGKEPGEEASAGAEVQSVVTRDPDGAFALAPAPGDSGPEAVLESGEQLYPSSSSSSGRSSVDPLIAAIGEGGGKTGALIVPVWAGGSGSGGKGSALEPGVLHYDGSAWTREPVCSQYSAETCTPASTGLEPLALAASSPQSAWLLARSSAGELELFQRVSGLKGAAAPVWLQVQFASGLLAAGGTPSGETLSAPGGGAILTATSQGVWVDLALDGGGQAGSATLLAAAAAKAPEPEGTDPGTVLGTWCYPTSLCPSGTPSLEATLPSDYASFAWAGSAGGTGTRIITGLPDGALLRLQEGQSAFSYEIGGGAGGAGGAVGPGGVTLGQLPGTASTSGGGAAFASPSEGWLGDNVSSGTATTPQVIHATAAPSADRLQSWPISLRNPLLAIAAAPGSTPGAAGAEALAVGVHGGVARYVPNEGWTPEYLYNGSGEREEPNLRPNLRGVAWPEPGRAYAVGDNGAMWLWQADSGLWEPDPAEPIGFRGQLTAIAFSATNTDVGYAVGKQGVLLAYGKSWTQQTLPSELSTANFTSVAFAGEEAIATYRILSPTPSKPSQEVGGIVVNDGSGWQVEPQVQGLLSQLPPQETVISKVAGLPDGGAVIAGPGLVIERDSATSPWHFSSAPLPEAANVSALAAIQEGSSVQALLSLEPGNPLYDNVLYEEVNDPPGPALGQYGQLLGPDPLPERGYLLRETASGWRDEELEDYPKPKGGDLPGWPDAVLALLVEPSGQQGWAVGGQTGEELVTNGQSGAQEAVQTAGVMRYGGGVSTPQSTSAPIPIPAEEASFALGGDAQCASACAELANEQLGPDAWLAAAVSRGGQISGLRAFLYAGGRQAPGLGPESAREADRYAQLLGSSGSVPVYTALSAGDTEGGTASTFAAAFAAFPAPFGEGATPSGVSTAGIPSGTATPGPGARTHYAFESAGSGGTVLVIVIDNSRGSLAASDPYQNPAEPQAQWLEGMLAYAKQSGIPAIVLGNRPLSSSASTADVATDAAEEAQIIVKGGASAYLFESPEQNLETEIGSGSETIPAYGSGTLGYVSPALNDPDDFLGASGFLLVSVDAAQASPEDNVVNVTAKLVPSIGQLGLEAADGTLLRRSHVALFQGLARRPLGGEEKITNGGGELSNEAPEPYTPIPETCLGANCSQFIAPAYSFTSSKRDVGQFVEQDPNSANARAVLQGPGGKPVPDEPRSSNHELNPDERFDENQKGEPLNENGEVVRPSGLFCAYNAGTTTVKLTTGGLSYSEQVTVEAGSVEQPCGTIPLINPPAAKTAQSTSAVVPPPASAAPAPIVKPQLSLTPPAPPAIPPRPAPKPHPPASRPLQPLLLAPAPTAPLRVVVPAPVPQPARPTPPSGTSQVTQPVGVAEQEREKQEAVDVVHNMAAYSPGGDAPPPWLPVALVMVAAAAGVGIRRAGRGHRHAHAWADTRSGPPRRR